MWLFKIGPYFEGTADKKMEPIMKSKILASMTVFSLSMTVFGGGLAKAEGGATSGGGHQIEALFKARVLAIADELTHLSKNARANLKFDVNALVGVIAMPGAFKPICATGKTLRRVQAESKMARVFSENRNVVNLDCARYGLAEWRKILLSENPQDAVFPLHEALRVTGTVDENDYAPSASYLAAAQEEDRVARQVVRELSRYRYGDKCSLQSHGLLTENLSGTRSSLTLSAYFTDILKEEVTFRNGSGNGNGFEDAISDLISTGRTKWFPKFTARRIYELARENNCLN